MNIEEDFLAHHGIKNQKHGVRRFQNLDGSLTEEGRKRYGVGPPRDSKEAKKNKAKLAKEEKRSEKKAARAAKIAEKRQFNAEEQKTKLREEIIRDPRKITKYDKMFTKDEVNNIISEIEWNKKLATVRRDETQRRLQKVKDLSDALGTFSNVIQNATNVYNNAAAINNALVAAGTFKNGKTMTKIGEGGKNKQQLPLKKGDSKENSKSSNDYTGKHLKHCLDMKLCDVICSKEE